MQNKSSITMQSFIDDYINGEQLGKSLDSFLKINPQHEMAITLKKTYLAIHDVNLFSDTIQAIQNTNYQKYSVEEQLIYFQFLCHFYTVYSRINNAYLSLSAANKLITPKLPPEFKVIPFDMEAQISRVQGETEHTTNLFKKCVDTLSPKSGKYKIYLWVYLMQICFENDNKNLLKYFEEYKNIVKETEDKYRIEYINLLLETECANFNAIPKLIAEIQKDPSLQFIKFEVEIRQHLFKLIEENDSSKIAEDDFRYWQIISLAYIKSKQFDKALEWAHKISERKRDYLFEPNLMSYYLLRAELANKNTNAAIYSLQQRRLRKNTTIYDDFFYFRIHHIKNEPELAQVYFNNFYNNILDNNLEKRLDFEISLSPELTQSVIMKYASSFQKHHTTSSLNSKNKENIKPEIIIGNSQKIEEIKKLIEKFAPLSTTILITGETGTGKELIAKAIHESSLNKQQPFLAINCGCISDHLLQSELFGHTKGAFTGAINNHEGLFEKASDGTLFLDEIGEINQTMQVALLRVLEANEFKAIGSNTIKKIKCRIIAATNQNLDDLVNAGSFRKDLKFRLERLMIEAPPLRERSTDIPILIDYFLNILNSNLPPLNFEKECLKHLCSLPWEGNIRELRNEMERIRLLYSDRKILTFSEISENYQPKNKPSQKNISTKQASNLNLKTLNELKELFKIHEKLTREQIAKKLNISLSSVDLYLSSLENENFIKKKGKLNAKSTFYEQY